MVVAHGAMLRPAGRVVACNTLGARLLPPGCRATWTLNGRHDERWLQGLVALQALHVEFGRLVVRCVCSTIMHPRCLVMWCNGPAIGANTAPLGRVRLAQSTCMCMTLTGMDGG